MEQQFLFSLPLFRLSSHCRPRDTGLYYLQSRYYDPAIGRFINADCFATTDTIGFLSYNMFAYCENDPINRSDPTGELSIAAKIAIGFGAIAIGVGLTALTGGGAIPVLIASLKIAGGSALWGAITGAASSAYNSLKTNGSLAGSGKDIINGAVNGAADGFMWGGISAGTAFSAVAASGNKIVDIGRISGVRAKKGYPGVRYQNSAGKFKSIEIHPNHHGHGIHLQKNTWWYNFPQYKGQPYRASADWRISLFKWRN